MDNNSGLTSGMSYPLGATLGAQGVNFSIYSKNSISAELLLFDHVDDPKPARVILLDPKLNRTFRFWHVYVAGLGQGQLYGYRVNGPNDPRAGHRFNGQKLLIDPYGRGVAIPSNYDRKAATHPKSNIDTSMKSLVVDPSSFDWEGDAPLHMSFSKTIIYEMHVGGFTRHPSSGVGRDKRGTYAGLVEKIPYLKDLGITAVELLPVLQFDEQEAPNGLTNYWGYNPVSFFAPHGGYCSLKDPMVCLDKFRDMVKALHRAGIEIILDVVYNHTAEGDQWGPTFCFRGLENSVYYMLEADKSRYANFSGTGNTLNANHPMVRRLIMDSLHYWVQEMHVDGFRFDLASILSRDESGKPLANPPILLDIETDPVLAGTKLIAEAWDAAGLYQVGSFIGDRWKEWNGRFRDDVRGFLRGDAGMASKVASRFLASPDLYGHEEREPEQSINFVTCHDGFTLNDLVSYNRKHNEANGEDNRDGSDYNLSWNCGVEGPTEDLQIEKLRNRQVKNFLTTTLLALGVPMLLMGDEMRRTQLGNNNTYCQDNEISWMNWGLQDKHADILRFLKRLIRVRLSLDVFQENHGLSLSQLLHQAKISWHGVELDKPDWEYNSQSLAFTVQTRRERFHIILNAYKNALEFEIPPVSGLPDSGWRRVIDTFFDSPDDFCSWLKAPFVRSTHYLVHPYSIVVLGMENLRDEQT